MKRIICVLMASGRSVRFGENKLIYPINGKKMFEYAVDAASISEITERVTLTIHPEVRKMSLEHDIPCVLHNAPYRSQAIAYGMKYIKEMLNSSEGKHFDGIMFCPCDQPYLKAESVGKLCRFFFEDTSSIARLCSKNGPGSPVIFPIRYLNALAELPLEAGGSYIIKQHLDSVRECFIEDPLELKDIDTKADL